MSDDATYIRRAIALARQAREGGNHPFGALLVASGQIVLEAENSVVTRNDPTHHAEMNLVQAAWGKLPADVIRRATLYTSTEPCPMCTGALYWSGIRRVVFSFPAGDLAAMTGETFCVPCRSLLDGAEEKTEVVGPVLADEGRQVHLGFWTPGDERQAATNTDVRFGSRFLAELRRLGVGAGNWNYATVTAIESAERERFVELFKSASPKPTYELIQLALSAEPEALARKLVEGQRADLTWLTILLSL